MDKHPKNYQINSIGIIQTPYINKTPRQPLNEDDGEFILIVNKEFSQGLKLLDGFRYIYVLFYLDKLKWTGKLKISKPLETQKNVGVFATRSPDRPNSIGLSVVKIKKIVDNHIYISGIDAFNGTPLLDIKPYIKKLDIKPDANNGWIDDIKENNNLK